MEASQHLKVEDSERAAVLEEARVQNEIGCLLRKGARGAPPPEHHGVAEVLAEGADPPNDEEDEEPMGEEEHGPFAEDCWDVLADAIGDSDDDTLGDEGEQEGWDDLEEELFGKDEEKGDDDDAIRRG